jgi:hypothetical protein
MQSIGSEVALTISYNYDKDNTPIDLRGVFDYADGKSDETLRRALENPCFKEKYCDMEKINREYYQSRYGYITEIANLVKLQVQSVDPAEPNNPEKNTYFWKNSTGQHFAPQFNNPDNDKTSVMTKTIKLDAEGRGSFLLYMNENLTRFNNPRSLVPPKLRGKGFSTNPVISSIAITCDLNATFVKNGTEKIFSQDGVSAIYYESNPDLGEQFPDWKNYVGPRLRVMGLLYPAMQKIIDLYSFKQVNLDSMKRAFDIESENHSRYMPSTREISSFEHFMIRRWLYEPFFDHDIHTNIDYSRITAAKQHIFSKPTFQEKKANLRNKLKDAFAFELFTIPLYLTAMYTSPSS